jgi:hypothetical protein
LDVGFAEEALVVCLRRILDPFIVEGPVMLPNELPELQQAFESATGELAEEGHQQRVSQKPLILELGLRDFQCLTHERLAVSFFRERCSVFRRVGQRKRLADWRSQLQTPENGCLPEKQAGKTPFILCRRRGESVSLLRGGEWP